MSQRWRLPSAVAVKAPLRVPMRTLTPLIDFSFSLIVAEAAASFKLIETGREDRLAPGDAAGVRDLAAGGHLVQGGGEGRLAGRAQDVFQTARRGIGRGVEARRAQLVYEA